MEIASYTYEAITTSKGMVLCNVGSGAKYLGAYRDNDGNWLDGKNRYDIVVPEDSPAINSGQSPFTTMIRDASLRTPRENRASVRLGRTSRSSRMVVPRSMSAAKNPPAMRTTGLNQILTGDFRLSSAVWPARKLL